ncbi:MAG: YnbE family lipoprotein [Alphaproteobacteria bacterium]|nr:YnbE family lipoprotein [Alphaproteobacteria bacterium]
MIKKTVAVVPAFITLLSCTPTVQVQAPDKPIEINLNVNIEQHVKVEIQKEVQQAITKNPDVF